MFVERKEELLSQFRCQQSGNCCRCPGKVYVTESNIAAMSKLLDMSEQAFRHQYVRRDNGWSVVATERFRPHCFLTKANTCQVYRARPDHCRSYPDWPSIWESDEALLKEADLCPGLKALIKKHG